jgi:sugar (pentulose or hexulose) kinase
VVADLTGRPVVVPSETELVSAGAAVQAAAVCLGRGFTEVSDAWGLGHGDLVEPDPRVDRAGIRDAYAAAAAAAAGA